MGDHAHQLNIPPHSHNFSLPDHVHGVAYGIYEGTTASSLQLSVDGKSIGNYANRIDSVDLCQWLTSGAKVARGWHEIRITPNTLTRVEANLSVQLFANSRGGGQY